MLLHVTYAFQSESTLYSCLNVQKHLARNRRDIWSLRDSNGIRTSLAKMFSICLLSGCGFESRCCIFIITSVLYFVIFFWLVLLLKKTTNSPFRYRVTNDAFLTWMFFMPLWRTIINSVKKTNKRKRNKNLKMPSFWQYLTVQIVLTERKTSLITVFPKMLKIMAKKAWNFRKWEGKSG